MLDVPGISSAGPDAHTPTGGSRHDKSTTSMNINLRTLQQLQQNSRSLESKDITKPLIPSSSSLSATNSTSLPPPLLSPPQEHQFSNIQHPDPRALMMDYQRSAVYDALTHRGADVHQLRPDVPPGPPREQLPPLSSLFAGPRSSMSSRAPYGAQSPTFPQLSPSRPQQTPTHGIPERKSWEVAYSPQRPSPPTSSPNLYNPRAPHAPADISQHPPRPMQFGQATNSPRAYDSRYSPKHSPRTQLPGSRNGWSPRTESTFGDYFPPVVRDGSASFRHPPDPNRARPPHPPTPDPRSLSSRMETSHRPSSAAHLGSDMGSNTSSESKDGLGPKIWTGTQFLPRFIRQAEVPGEGLCYFYDDGTHCKTFIDGEAVNAHWGVTKAGKPRKRLAIACIACRDKKIKCDPDFPRCTQCDKFGRLCTFKNAPRGGHGSPEMSPEVEETSHHPVLQPSMGEPTEAEKREGSRTYSVHSSHRHSSIDSDENPLKRAKFFHPATVLQGNGSGHQAITASPRQSPQSIRREPDLMIHQSSTNPLDVDEDLVMELMRLYFLHNGSTDVHCLFPEKPFMLWFTNRCVTKSPDDLMLIYTLLAMATVFSTNPLHKERGKEFAAVGRYACDQRQYSLQLVQSRLLLALYYFAHNSPNDTWDFCGAALRAATGMKLNLEIDKADMDGVSEHPYNLHRDGHIECRRRTFWACYVLEKLLSFSSRHLSIISSEDIFLRLPCDAKAFEAQVEVNNPFFEPSSPIGDHISTVGSLAYLINICSIWGDVMAHMYRHFQRADSDDDPHKMLSFHAATTARLQEWSSSLPDWLTYSSANLAMSSANGSLGSFITLHSLYRSAQMKVNRHLRPCMISRDQLEHGIRAANEHAEALLLMADHLAARPKLPSHGGSGESAVPFSAPFIGHAIISAVDIVTAKGYLSFLPSIPSKTNGAMAVITELCAYWESAKQQRESINRRKMELVVGSSGWRPSTDLSNVNPERRQGDGMGEVNGEGSVLRASGRHHGSLLGTYEMQEPMEKMFARGNDCFYAVSLEVWDRALAKGGA